MLKFKYGNVSFICAAYETEHLYKMADILKNKEHADLMRRIYKLKNITKISCRVELQEILTFIKASVKLFRLQSTIYRL